MNTTTTGTEVCIYVPNSPYDYNNFYCLSTDSVNSAVVNIRAEFALSGGVIKLNNRITLSQDKTFQELNPSGKGELTFVGGISTLPTLSTTAPASTSTIGNFNKSEFHSRVTAAFSKTPSVETVETHEAVTHYTEIGLTLKDDPIVQNLMNEICETRNNAVSNLPFYFVNAHSGMGKTQLPFAFKAAGVKVCHLIMIDNFNQSIYQSLSTLSELFADAVKADNDPTIVQFDFNSLAHWNREWFTVGFIFSILGLTFVESQPWTIEHLKGYVRTLESKENLPIFFLDEVLPHHDRDPFILSNLSSNLRFARNLLREVGLVPVLMGTNSSAANIIHFAASSRGDATNWCKLITTLPLPNESSRLLSDANEVKMQLSNIPSLSSICPFLTQQFRVCTPWFIELFINAFKNININQMNAVDFLDDVLSKMANLVVEKKQPIRSKIGLEAQFCLHLNDCKFPSETILETNQNFRLTNRSKNPCIPEDTSSFVANHFATLKDNNCILQIRGKRLFKENERNIPWQAPAAFTRATNECFLYLMLCDGNLKNNFPPPFLGPESGMKLTTMETLKMLKVKQTIVVGVNKSAVKREGNILELLSAVGIEIASHRGGLGGILFLDFILQLSTELLFTFQDLTWMNPPVRILIPSSSTEKKSKRKHESESESQQQSKHESEPQYEYHDIPDYIKNMKIPYLSCEGDTWPNEFKQINGVMWGELIRTSDNERIDMKIRTTAENPPITVECKNYESPLEIKDIKKILDRISGYAWLHIVICTRLQGNYFTSNKWETYKNDQNLRFENTAIFKVVIIGSNLSLQPLFDNSVPSSYTQVVLFLPFEDWPINQIELDVVD